MTDIQQQRQNPSIGPESCRNDCSPSLNTSALSLQMSSPENGSGSVSCGEGEGRVREAYLQGDHTVLRLLCEEDLSHCPLTQPEQAGATVPGFSTTVPGFSTTVPGFSTGKLRVDSGGVDSGGVAAKAGIMSAVRQTLKLSAGAINIETDVISMLRTLDLHELSLVAVELR